MCDQCEAKAPCLEFALTTNQDSGVWGGTSEEERRKLRRQWARRPAPRLRLTRPALAITGPPHRGAVARPAPVAGRLGAGRLGSERDPQLDDRARPSASPPPGPKSMVPPSSVVTSVRTIDSPSPVVGVDARSRRAARRRRR